MNEFPKNNTVAKMNMITRNMKMPRANALIALSLEIQILLL